MLHHAEIVRDEQIGEAELGLQVLQQRPPENSCGKRLAARCGRATRRSMSITRARCRIGLATVSWRDALRQDSSDTGGQR